MTASSDRLVHGDELGAVRKGRFDLNVMDHFGNARHHLSTGQNLGTGLHQVGHGAAVARALDDEIGDDGDRMTPRSSRRRATMAAIEIRSLSFSRGDRFMRAL